MATSGGCTHSFIRGLALGYVRILPNMLVVEEILNVYPLCVLVLGILYAYLVSVYLFLVGDLYFCM